MRNFFYKIQSLSLALVFIFSHYLYALPPEDLSNFESLTTQAVSNQELSAQYNITGESVVNIIRGMVDFDLPGTSIVYNRRTGQIFVRHTPSSQLKIEKIITSMRTVAFQQVEIEARFVTVGATDFKGVGVDLFGGDFTTTWKGTQIGTEIPKSNDVVNNFSSFDSFVNSLNDASYGSQFSAVAFGDLFDVAAFIDALESRTEVNTLANPRITVFNNQRAHLKIEKRENYISKIESDLQMTGSGADSTPIFNLSAKVAQAESGTILDVTPAVNNNGTITLELHPHFLTADLTSVRSIKNLNDGQSLENPITLPVFTSQSINTSLTIPNGGVAILGGLITEKESKAYKKVPFFGDMPLVGKTLFTQEQKTDEKQYLLIFVKAFVKDGKSEL
jgi:type II secretory pathway component GspD/PulD (secretin)